MFLRRALMASAFAVLPALAHAQTAPKTTLTIGMAAQDMGRLDPHFAVSTIDRAVMPWIYNGLVRFKPGSMNPADIEPDLAQSWESSPDKLTWTFHLRHGVKWQGNYGELTADDVVFSLKKAADPKTSAFSTDYKDFQSVEAVDPYTVKIVLKQPIPSLLGVLTNYSGGFIVPRKAVEQLGTKFDRNPVGTGPFSFVSDTPNQSLELQANPDYFRGKPQVAHISYRFIPSGASRDLAFQNGETDVTFGVQDQHWIDRMKKLAHTKVDVFEPGEESELNLNITVPPLNDIRVRQAIAYAVDRPQIVRWKGTDTTREALSVVPRGYLGTITENNGLLPHDLKKAKQLLAEAGHPNGITLHVIHTQLPDMLSSMQVVQEQLKKAGINLDLQVVEHATFHQMIRKDLSPIVYYTAARFPVADIYLTQFFDSHSIVGTPTAVTNFSHCNVADPEIEKARTETDPKKQLELWAEAQKKIIAAVCAVPLMETLQVWAHHDNVDWGYKLAGSLSLGPLITEKTRLVQ